MFNRLLSRTQIPANFTIALTFDDNSNLLVKFNLFIKDAFPHIIRDLQK